MTQPLGSVLRAFRRLLLLKNKVALHLNIPYHIRRLTQGFAIVQVNGFKMYLNLRKDRGISRDLFIFGKREHISTDYLLEHPILKAGDTAVDVGANIGYYVLLESKLVGPAGQVYAIEPVSGNYEMLRKNLELNEVKNTRTFHMAAGSVGGEADIHVGEKGNFSTFLHNPNERYLGVERVKVVRLDDFFKEHNITPTLIRMDVEGFESEIVAGMQETLKQKKPKLLIEVHPHIMTRDAMEQMFALFAESGYQDAIVIKERKDVWMRTDGSLHPMLAALTKRIESDGSALGIGKLEQMSLATLRQGLRKRGSAFHLLLS